ncbi:hypothetical protein L5515_017791 [Caenorhabditis briggsae]|uniref:Uncharacterized protein n=1 Tax=Caenorhabditis briggsae TaxID=6238 RepID=A0AAE9FAI2_CAEBR|nr:hypothetical protein L5515_017791 [Caenorhabditis briggsae]
MGLSSPTSRIPTTHAVPLTTRQSFIATTTMETLEKSLNATVQPDDIPEASALRNELLALAVLLCLLILGVVIYFVFRSMVYIKKEKAQERLPINTFAPINLP